MIIFGEIYIYISIMRRGYFARARPSFSGSPLKCLLQILEAEGSTEIVGLASGNVFYMIYLFLSICAFARRGV